MRKYAIKNCNRNRDWVVPGVECPMWLKGLYISNGIMHSITTNNVYDAKLYKTYEAAKKQADVLNERYSVKEFGHLEGFDKVAPDFVVVGIDIEMKDCTVG